MIDLLNNVIAPWFFYAGFFFLIFVAFQLIGQGIALAKCRTLLFKTLANHNELLKLVEMAQQDRITAHNSRTEAEKLMEKAKNAKQ